MAGSEKFDLDRLTALFQACAATTDAATNEVDTAAFLSAVKEVLKVFAGLGKIFDFAFSDVRDKVGATEKQFQADQQKYAKLTAFIDEDNANGQIPPNEKGQTRFRDINRMAHVCYFICCLMDRLVTTDEELAKALRTVYPETLARIHVWMVKKTVETAFMAAPYRASFLKSLDVDDAKLKAQGPEFCTAARTVYATVQKSYEARGLPWIFE